MGDERAFNAFGHLSYNQVVERLIAFEEAQQFVMNASAEGSAEAQHAQEALDAQEHTEDNAIGDEQDTRTQEMIKVIEESMPIKEFMDGSASQLSYEGLLTLHRAVRERELAIFYRNSHFSAMLKYSGDLYLLCTDIAFANSEMVWERLDEVDGDTVYCDANFIMNVASNFDIAISPAPDVVSTADTIHHPATYGSLVNQFEHSDAVPTPTQLDLDARLALQFVQDDLYTESERIVQKPATSRVSAAPKAVAGAQRPEKKKRERFQE